MSSAKNLPSDHSGQERIRKSKMSLMEGFADVFRRQPHAWGFCEAFALVVIIGFLDYLTGYEVAFFPFYSIPILLMVWFGSRNAAIAISVLSALAWWLADRASGHLYSTEWLRAWDSIVRLMFFGLVMIAGIAFKQQRDVIRARIELLERSRRLEREIINISERERQGIGRDLHDGLCQYLAAIGFTAGLLKSELENESHTRAATACDIADRLQDAVVLARDMARGLSPVDRDEGGLESALEDLASNTARLMNISCVFICPEPVKVEDNNSAVHLFRIAQEALNNDTKHGRAKSVVIALERNAESLSLRISDDGVGFPVVRSAKNGMGLNIMRYRARMLGGKLDIQPNCPVGVVVTCAVEKSAGVELDP
jgi:signal transduction histidine kinase